MSARRFWASGRACALVAVASGCNFFPDHRFAPDAPPRSDAPPDAGADAPVDAPLQQVTFDWSVTRNGAPATCAELGLAPAEVILSWHSLATGGSVRTACDLGTATATVEQGSYELKVQLAAIGGPSGVAVLYDKIPLEVAADMPNAAVAIAEAGVRWHWESQDFAACSDPNATLRLIFDGVDVAVASCAAQEAAGFAPIGTRAAFVQIVADTPGYYAVQVTVPAGGGDVALVPQ